MMESETIFNFIPREEKVPEKPQRYTSKFTKTVIEEYNKNKGLCKTIGPAHVQTNKPQDFLKKRSKEPTLPEKKEITYEDEVKKPAIPGKEEKPVMGLQTRKNFITLNAMTNIMSVPRKPVKCYVDTKEGETQRLTPSGFQPKYIHKKDYGKVPVYLERQRKSQEQAQLEYEQYLEAKRLEETMKELGQENREALLQGLKTNWEELHHEYLCLSMVSDTDRKRNRKEVMEIEMKRLEGYIDLIKRHNHIYIAD